MIQFVVAYSTNYVIGKDGKMPWSLPSDLLHFKQITNHHTVVMGRKTFESIGKPLNNRRNIVLTKQQSFTADGIEVIHNLDEVFQFENPYVIGGANLFSELLHVVDRMYITEIHQVIEGDTFFPKWDKSLFTLVSTTPGTIDEKNKIPHTFCVYDRISK